MQSDNKQPLPPELDWSNMKDGIFDKIESIEQEESSLRNSKKSRRRIGFFFILFWGLLIGLYTTSKIMTTDQLVEAPNVIQLPKADVSENKSKAIINEVAPDRIESSGKLLTEEKRKNKGDKLRLTSELSELNRGLEKSQNPPINIDRVPVGQSFNRNDQQFNILDTDHNESIKNMLDTTQKALTPVANISPKNLLWQHSELPTLPAHNLDQITYKKTSHSIFDIQESDHLTRPNNPSHPHMNQLIVEGGITFWNEGYGNNKPEKAQFETPLPSFQLQAHYKKGIRGNYFILAGLQYQQLESKFQFNNTIQDYKITIEDRVIEVRNNSLTGEQTIIRGDVEQFVRAEQRIVHYNTTKLFKLSLAVGKTWRFNSFQTDIYLGGATNSLVHNEGRMFNNDTVIDYDGASNSFFQNQWKVDGVLGVRLHYLLNQNLGITSGFQTQRSLINWSNQSNTNFHPISFSLQFGLSYSL